MGEKIYSEELMGNLGDMPESERKWIAKYYWWPVYIFIILLTIGLIWGKS